MKEVVSKGSKYTSSVTKSIKHYPIGSQGNHWLVLDKQIESRFGSDHFVRPESSLGYLFMASGMVCTHECEGFETTGSPEGILSRIEYLAEYNPTARVVSKKEDEK